MKTSAKDISKSMDKSIDDSLHCWICNKELTDNDKCPDKDCDSHEGQ